MKHAYNQEALKNLHIVKEAGQWKSSHIISQDQYKNIATAFQSNLYHPNWIIRLLLFIATVIGLSGVAGLFFLMFADAGETGLAVLALIAGVVMTIAVENILIKNNHHYKSGVTEAMIYCAAGFATIGLAVLIDFDETLMLWSIFIVLTFIAWRYIDLLSTTGAFLLLAYLLFDFFYNMGGIVQSIIPILFLLIFTCVYFFIKSINKRSALFDWSTCFLLVEVGALIFIYAAGNYFVVRELSVNLMSMNLGVGEDIPLAWFFYFLTVIIPIVYLFFGIKKKDVVLLRVSLAVLAFSVFTFKYYFSLGHPEITLTIAGALLIGLSAILFFYLKVIRNGFTRENLLSEKWSSSTIQAIVVSQTLGGNVRDTEGFSGGGGSFSGGGSSEGF